MKMWVSSTADKIRFLWEPKKCYPAESRAKVSYKDFRLFRSGERHPE
jgi:hypothetical protein